MRLIKPISEYYQQESERLIYRAFQEGDVDSFLPFFDREDYMKFLAQDISIPARERAETWINRQIQRQNEGEYGQLAVIEKATGEFIGVGGIIARNWDGKEDYEMTYSLIPAFWGKGYARELVQHFIEFSKENLPVESVISMIHPENIASQKVAFANGLKLDGKWQFLDIPVNIYRVSLDK